jgi:hypothetical protein
MEALVQSDLLRASADAESPSDPLITLSALTVLAARKMSGSGTNAKYRLALKLSAYRGRPEVIGAQSE